jgi:hypothetical protein
MYNAPHCTECAQDRYYIFGKGASSATRSMTYKQPVVDCLLKLFAATGSSKQPLHQCARTDEHNSKGTVLATLPPFNPREDVRSITTSSQKALCYHGTSYEVACVQPATAVVAEFLVARIECEITDGVMMLACLLEFDLKPLRDADFGWHL